MRCLRAILFIFGLYVHHVTVETTVTEPEDQLMFRETSLIDDFVLKRHILQAVYGKYN